MRANEKVMRLPDRETMLKRLVAVHNDGHARQKFYPLLLQDAGQERVAGGIVMMLALAIHDYTEGLPPMIANLIWMRIDEYIDAICPDAEVAEAAKQFNRQAQAKAAKKSSKE